MADWFGRTGDLPPEAAWAIYHENSKRGRRLGNDSTRDEVLAPDHPPEPGGAIALPAARPLIRVTAEHAAGTAGQSSGGPMPLLALSSILATACRPLAGFDPTLFLLHARAVDTLSPGLYRVVGNGRALAPLAGDDPEPRLRAAMPTPEAAAQVDPQVVLFFVGALAVAGEASGERGYRRALVAIGRHAFALDLATAAAGVQCREVPAFHDREIDALLGVDGLSESALYVAALGTAGGGD